MAGSQTVAKAARRAPGGIGFFERYLSLWVALCIVVGIVLGKLLPGAVHTVSMLELAHVNIPVGILIWVMIIPPSRCAICQYQVCR